MIPLRDTLTLRRTPIVNRVLVFFTVAIFAVQFFAGEAAETYVRIFGFVPARFFDPRAFGYTPIEVGITLVSSIFLHGGVVHIVGNLLYLWIFGDDVEDRLGRLPYFTFYLSGGVVGSLVHAFLYPESLIPSIGASGSIAAVLGAFLVLHPKARIVTLLPLVV